MKIKLIYIMLFISSVLLYSKEITLFSSNGKPIAYIDTNDELTIYLWEGDPIAYLSEDTSDGHDLYGFNGKHLGWFIKGVVRDHNGDASCGVKDVMNNTQFESFKGFKKFKPFKNFKTFAPFKPFLSNSFGKIPCDILLRAGHK